MRVTVIMALLMLLAKAGTSCSCYGPPNFCQSMSYYNTPDLVILAEKTEDYYYGMKVRALEVLHGHAAPGDTLTVWGDNGALCRLYTSLFPEGDTLVLALYFTDKAGNFIHSPSWPDSLEQDGDYHLSACGVFWQNYHSGNVSGPGTDPVMNYSTFKTYLKNCIFTGTLTPEPAVFRVLPNPAHEWLRVEGAGGTVEIYDLQGRKRCWMQESGEVDISGLPQGLYFLKWIGKRGTEVRKVAVVR